MIFVAVSTLTACSSDESESQNNDKSFSHKIVDVKAVNEAGQYVESSSLVEPTNKSVIKYDEPEKTLTIFISEDTQETINVLSYKDGVFIGTYLLKGTSTPTTLDVEVKEVNGNYVFTSTSFGRVISKVVFITK